MPDLLEHLNATPRKLERPPSVHHAVVGATPSDKGGKRSSGPGEAGGGRAPSGDGIALFRSPEPGKASVESEPASTDSTPGSTSGSNPSSQSKALLPPSHGASAYNGKEGGSRHPVTKLPLPASPGGEGISRKILDRN